MRVPRKKRINPNEKIPDTVRVTTRNYISLKQATLALGSNQVDEEVSQQGQTQVS